MSCDPACHDLAEHFLADAPSATAGDRAQLAQHIQTAVEDCLWAYEQRPEFAAEIAPVPRGTTTPEDTR